MKEIIDALKTRIESSANIKHIDEDYGQLDLVQPPIKWPCALISINSGVFDNIGMDKKATPQQRQMGEYSVDIRIANLKLSNSNVKASAIQKENNLRIFDYIQEVHELVHGWSPGGMIGSAIRTRIQLQKRDDGIQEYVVTYSIALHNC